MKVCEFTTTTTAAQISIQVGQNVGAYITARDSTTPIAGQVSNTNDFVYFTSYAGLAVGNYDLHFEDTATPLKVNITAIINATITEIDFSELPHLTTVNISSVTSDVANAAVSSLWDAYGENVPSRGALTTPSLSGGAANIAAILQDFYGWTLNGVPLWQMVSTTAELEAISEGLAGNYKLANDIDLAGTTHTDSIFGVGVSIGFTGILDLNSHAIKNVTVIYSGADFCGILGTGFGGQLLNGELNGSISATSDAGIGFLSGSFGYNTNARIDGVKFTGTVHSASGEASGLCDNFDTALAANRVVTNCIFDVDVTSDTGSTYAVSRFDTVSTDKYIVFCNCLLTGSATSNVILGAGSSTVVDCYHNLSTSVIDGFTGLTAAEMADPATFAYTGTPAAWAEDTAYVVGDIVGDGTYAYVATEPSTGVHPSTLIGWKRLGFDFTGTRQVAGYDYAVYNGGTEYFDSGFVPNQDSKISSRIRVTSLATAVALFGVRDAYEVNEFWTYIDLADSHRMKYQAQIIEGGQISAGEMYAFEIDKNLLKRDGATVATAIYEPVSPDENSAYILALNEVAIGPSYTAPTILYDFSAFSWDGSKHVLAVNLIPQPDGTLLDTVSGQKLVNQGTGTITVVDLREVWKMVAGVPVLSWEQFGGARSRMSGIAFDLRYSRTTGGARVV